MEKQINKKPFGKFNGIVLRAFGYTENDVKVSINERQQEHWCSKCDSIEHECICKDLGEEPVWVSSKNLQEKKC